MRPIFQAFCINLIGIGLLHYISSRSDFGFEFSEIFVIEKRLPDSASSILFYSILFYSILFYSIIFYSILFYSILFYSILFYSILFQFKAVGFNMLVRPVLI
jgi:hypothetical protein